MMITKPGLQKIEKTHGLQTRKLKKENSDLLLSSKDNDMETTLHQQVLHSPILKVSQIKNKKKPPIRERRLSQPEIDNSKLSPFNLDIANVHQLGLQSPLNASKLFAKGKQALVFEK